MIITGITDSCRLKNMQIVILDGQEKIPLYKSDILKLKLAKGTEISEDYYKKICNELVYKRANEAAFRILARGDNTEKMLRNKLLAKEYPFLIVERICEELKKSGYIDETDYAVKFAQDALIRGKGKRYIFFELTKRGISKEKIEEIISELCNESKLKEIAEKKFNSIIKNKDTVDYKDIRKLGDFLFRQGYTYDEIREVTEYLKGKYES